MVGAATCFPSLKQALESWNSTHLSTVQPKEKVAPHWARNASWFVTLTLFQIVDPSSFADEPALPTKPWMKASRACRHLLHRSQSPWPSTSTKLTGFPPASP